MDSKKTEAEKNEVIAQHARGLYVRHRTARVLRRTLPREDNTRKHGERAERKALETLISVIETVDKTGGTNT